VARTDILPERSAPSPFAGIRLFAVSAVSRWQQTLSRLGLDTIPQLVHLVPEPFDLALELLDGTRQVFVARPRFLAGAAEVLFEQPRLARKGLGPRLVAFAFRLLYHPVELLQLCFAPRALRLALETLGILPQLSGLLAPAFALGPPRFLSQRRRFFPQRLGTLGPATRFTRPLLQSPLHILGLIPEALRFIEPALLFGLTRLFPQPRDSLLDLLSFIGLRPSRGRSQLRGQAVGLPTQLGRLFRMAFPFRAPDGLPELRQLAPHLLHLLRTSPGTGLRPALRDFIQLFGRASQLVGQPLRFLCASTQAIRLLAQQRDQCRSRTARRIGRRRKDRRPWRALETLGGLRRGEGR
jgi:hypothetical protein